MLCQSCKIKSNTAQKTAFYQYNGKVLCERCVTLEMVGMTTMNQFSGEHPKLIAPVFKEAVIVLPSQGIFTITHYLEEIKKQLFNMAKEQAIKEEGNAIVDIRLQISRLEGMHFLVSLSGTIVFSETWEKQILSSPPPVHIPHKETETPIEREDENTESTLHTTSSETVVGKYPDVGGSSQMNLFKKLVQKEK